MPDRLTRTEHPTAARRIVITGGAGFIGSHLTERLLTDGHQVLVVDDLSTGRRENLTRFAAEPRFRLLEHDITRPLPIDRLTGPGSGIDQIFHLACPASPAQYQADPVKTITTSTVGTLNVLELARASGATVLLASTSEVYGDPAVHPQRESYWGNVNPHGVRSCYDEGKRAAEAMFFSYSRQFGTPIKVARIFNTYGPRMQPDDGRVVSNFVVAALTGRPLVVAGDGGQTRSFCYVDDLVEALIRLMNGPAALTGPMNLGNPAEFTILELAQQVGLLFGGLDRIAFGPLPLDDPARRRPDIGYARSALGWEPKVSLAEGLRLTVEHFVEWTRDPAGVR